MVPESVARHYEILPLERTQGSLLLLCSRYLDADALEEIKSITGLDPKPLLTDPEDLKTAVEKSYGRRKTAETRKLRIGDILHGEGLITEEQLRICLEQQKHSRLRLGEIIVELGYASVEAVYTCLANKLDLEYRSFDVTELDLELTQLIPQKFAERHGVLPLAVESNTLVVAMSEPNDLNVRDSLEAMAGQRGYQLKAVLSSPASVTRGLAYTYNPKGAVGKKVEIEGLADHSGGEYRELVLGGEASDARSVVNQILYSAVVEGASDVHIEQMEDRVPVRFRIDGILHERKTPISKENVASVISVLKLDAGLDITERRRAQDGVLKMRVDGDRFVDFRLSIQATGGHGEDAVIRILDKERNLLPLDKLGLPGKIADRCHRLIENPQGLLLITGPTGSGKTTSLYSMLGHLNGGHKKIVTAEDPVEYQMDGISQYQVDVSLGNTFADYARRFLRKDPDVILIGEIRDDETAATCIKAAMTGHLVFSTLHTNDSLGALVRLLSLGVDSSSVADSLLAVLSQRLVRRVCPQCQTDYQPDPQLVEEFYGQHPPQDVQFRSGDGCSGCGQIGYRGRVGLYEMWETNREVRKLVESGASEAEIREASMESGALSTMMQDAMLKVESGMTTLEELRRILPVDQIATYAQSRE